MCSFDTKHSRATIVLLGPPQQTAQNGGTHFSKRDRLLPMSLQPPLFPGPFISCYTSTEQGPLKHVQALTIKTQLSSTDLPLLGSTWESNQSHGTLGRVSQIPLGCWEGKLGWEQMCRVGVGASAGAWEQSCPTHLELQSPTLNQHQMCMCIK